MAATHTTTRKAAAKPQARKANGNGKAKANGKAKTEASRRPQYSDDVRAITERARSMACPTTRQGPVAKQVAAVMAGLKQGPQAALKEADISRKDLEAIAHGKANGRALKPLADQITGARQWTSGRPLAATLVAWLEHEARDGGKAK